MYKDYNVSDTTSESSTVNEVTGCSKRFWMSFHYARQVFLMAVSLQLSITHLALGLHLPIFRHQGLNCVRLMFLWVMDNKCTYLSQSSSNLHSNVYCSLFNLSTCVYLDDQDLQRLHGPLVPSWHFLDVTILWSRCICNSHLVHCSCMYIDNVNVTCTMSLYRWNFSQS